MELGNFDCIECRSQYDEANRPDRVPCDIGGLEACPYYNRPCGSPGDTGPDGCGLASENEGVIEFYPRWKFLGDSIFQLTDLEFNDPTEADEFIDKLMMIESYSRRIREKNHVIEEAKSKQREASKRK